MRSCREKEIKFLVRTLVRVSHKYFFIILFTSSVL